MMSETAKVRPPYFLNLPQVLAKITSKNQLTLPKSVTEPLGPVQYFDVQIKAGQIVLTPVRIQRGDALRAKLAELDLSDKTLAKALSWAEGVGAKKPASKKTVAKPLSAAKQPAAKSSVSRKTAQTKPLSQPGKASRAGKSIETRPGPGKRTVSKRAGIRVQA